MSKEVKNMARDKTCRRCGATNGLTGLRFRAGGPWVDPADGESYTELCEDCHRELVRS